LNRATTGEAGSQISLKYRRHPASPTLEITGSIPADAETVTRTVAVINPTRYFAQAVKDALVAAGIPVRGEAVDLDEIATELTDANGERRVLAETLSPPLSEMAVVLMKVSQNQYAESFLKAIGAAA